MSKEETKTPHPKTPAGDKQTMNQTDKNRVDHDADSKRGALNKEQNPKDGR